MNFPHEDPQFSNLLRIVAEKRKLTVGLVEKDYWVTHTLWALHQGADLQVWFKGGTSLSKGFSLIHRFSEDLDLRIDSTTAGVKSTAWPKKPTKAQVAARVKYFQALELQLVVPGAKVDILELNAEGRGADYKVTYPGQFVETVAPPNSPFVKLEVGRALVSPFVPRSVASFVHEELEALGQLASYADNRASNVRCVHPRVTLIEKLDAIAWRFDRNRDPSEYIRHYEDAARIIQEEGNLPPLEETFGDTAKAIGPSLRLKRLAPADHPAFATTAAKDARLQAAHDAIGPMFWAPRLSLEDACRTIRDWRSPRRRGG